MEVGKRIRDLRRQRGISLRDLARRSGVSKAYLSQLENDPDRKPSVDVVLRIAAALEVSLADLVGPEPGVAAPAGGGSAAPTAAGRPTPGGAPPAHPGTNPVERPRAAGPAIEPGAGLPAEQIAAGAEPVAEPPPLEPDDLPWALRVFWQENPHVPEEEIRSLATITWRGRRPFTPTDYWVLHQVLTGMTRGV
ncbi:helix-turn-helix domain-containing protein [Thermaerobacter litoralis]